ncbi:MAG: hypothetical protein VXA88_12530 [Rhodospirillales bacterium]|jgi:hypothetical protein
MTRIRDFQKVYDVKKAAKAPAKEEKAAAEKPAKKAPAKKKAK